MARRKHRPSDPAEAARKAYETRRNPAMWGPNAEALQLEQNRDIHTTQPETRTKTKRIERFDVFSTIKLSDHQFQAVRRYHFDLAEANRAGDGDGGSLEVVDGGSGSRELVTARMIAATSRCLDLYSRLSGPDIRLLKCLSYPVWVEGKPANWKLIVKACRGLIDRDAAASCVKTLSESVRIAYAEIDGMSQRRAA